MGFVECDASIEPVCAKPRWSELVDSEDEEMGGQACSRSKSSDSSPKTPRWADLVDLSDDDAIGEKIFRATVHVPEKELFGKSSAVLAFGKQASKTSGLFKTKKPRKTNLKVKSGGTFTSPSPLESYFQENHSQPAGCFVPPLYQTINWPLTHDVSQSSPLTSDGGWHSPHPFGFCSHEIHSQSSSFFVQPTYQAINCPATRNASQPSSATFDGECHARFEKRQAAIADMKDKQLYMVYSGGVSRNERNRAQTPNPMDRNVSKRRWEANVHQWRTAMRDWCATNGYPDLARPQSA